jgi:hypothetical protein
MPVAPVGVVVPQEHQNAEMHGRRSPAPPPLPVLVSVADTAEHVARVRTAARATTSLPERRYLEARAAGLAPTEPPDS